MDFDGIGVIHILFGPFAQAQIFLGRNKMGFGWRKVFFA